MVYLNLEENKSYEYIIIVLTQIISIGSTYVLKKFTELEKYSSKSKDIFSVIKKYFWLNFFVSVTIFCKKNNYFIFTYIKMENYYILNKVIIMNMFYSIFTSHLSYLFSFILNFVKRFGDSKYDNGKTTKLNNKIKYEKLYLGPDFPFEERYAKILVNLSICLVYGTNCPIIYFFFVLFLIATFLIDKFLMINFYKKPPLYGGIIAKKMKSYFYFCVFLYIYGVFYNVSTPYLFQNDLLKHKFKHWNRYDLETTFSIISYILNPVTFFYYFIYIGIFNTNKEKISFLYCNFNFDILIVTLVVFLIIFVNPTSMIKKILTPKNKFLSFVNVSPVEIGKIYPLEELNKYYEIKKLQLFDLIMDCNKNDLLKEDYSDLINNYMQVIKYIKYNIDNKNKKQNDKIDLPPEVFKDELSPLKGLDSIKNNRIQIAGDISYNQSFINKYEIYNNFSLMKNI